MLKIGVDGGGTTTRAVIIQHAANAGDIQVLGRGEAASSNHYGVGLNAAFENIRQAINIALEIAKVSRNDIGSFGFGLAGACTDAEQSLISNKLSSLIGGQSFVVDDDASAAQSGAFAGGSGAVCIAGTGANCFGVNEKKERARADGLGPLLGDRGGGYHIGEAALRAICAANDGSGPPTSLVAPILESFEITSINDLVQVVYQPDFARNRVAALFPIVLQEEKNGDAIAHQLLSEAGRALAFTTGAVLRKLGLSRVAIVGGVFENSDIVRQNFKSELTAYLSASMTEKIEIIAPQYDAAIGAALLVKN